MHKILLVYPKNPVTFWSFDESLAMVGKKSVYPPLGLLTIAGMLPDSWELKVVDVNITPLEDADIAWADAVLTSSMIIHWPSLEEIIASCNDIGIPVLCGGPLPTQYWKEIAGRAVFYLGEAENGFVDLVEEMILQGPECPSSSVDHRGSFKSLDETPLPRWDLVDCEDYLAMVVQMTRGCPEHCTFCNIPALYGKTTRLKESNRTVRELDMLYEKGWRGGVMVVDDNFIGNSDSIRATLNDEIIPWQKERGFPFQFHTQVSVRLSDDEPLMEAMFSAGFFKVFCGIESPSSESLKFMGAQKNLQGDMTLLEKVLKIQDFGFEVQAGFIIGLDADPDDIADLMIDFIQDANIPIAMVGILGVVPDTPDFKRFKRSGRLVENIRYTGDTGIFSRTLSYVPTIDPDELFARHRKVVETIYSPKKYFERCHAVLSRKGRPAVGKDSSIGVWHVKAFASSIWNQGFRSSYKGEYWRLLAAGLKRPKRFQQAVHMAVAGHHLITATERALQADDVRSFLDQALERFEEYCKGALDAFQTELGSRTARFDGLVHKRLRGLRDDLDAMHRSAAVLMEVADETCSRYMDDFESHLQEPLARLRRGVDQLLSTHSRSMG